MEGRFRLEVAGQSDMEDPTQQGRAIGVGGRHPCRVLWQHRCELLDSRLGALAAPLHQSGPSCALGCQFHLPGYPFHAAQYTPGKNFWRSGAFGPWLVTKDEIPDPESLVLETRLNGEVMQHAPISDLLFDIPYLIHYRSVIFPLSPGDVITTGTPSGVGRVRNPTVFLKAGDRIEVEISRIGILSNPVEDEHQAFGS